MEKKEFYNARDLAIIRIEQLHPFPKKQLSVIVKKYPNVVLSLWVQEEPENMGAWPFIHRKLPEFNFRAIARSESASPASGLFNVYQQRQRKIIDDPFSA